MENTLSGQQIKMSFPETGISCPSCQEGQDAVIDQSFIIYQIPDG